MSERDFEKYASAIYVQLELEHGSLRAADQQKLRAEYAERNFEDWATQELRNATKGLTAGIIHDHLQLLSTISQNMDLILTLRYGDTEGALGPDMPPVTSLRDPRRVWELEKAVLLTCELLSERQKASRLLTEDSALQAEDWAPCSPHGLFMKFAKLFRKTADEKGVRIQLGPSYAQCYVPKELTSIPALALLDNAIKYAPSNAVIHVRFVETESAVVVTVESPGPRIEEDERDLVFTAGYRGRHATSRASGSGIGLWQARRAMRGWGTLVVDQDAASSNTQASAQTRFVWTIQRRPQPV